MNIPDLSVLQNERSGLLQEILGIDQMIRGHLTAQTFSVRRGGETFLQGPYPILQRRENGKNNCQRVPEADLGFISSAVEGYQRFQKLMARYAALTEQMTWLRQPPDVKKKFRRFCRPISPTPPPA